MSTILFSDAHFASHDPYGLKPFREKALRTVLGAGAKADMIVDAGDAVNQRYFDIELLSWLTNIYTECLRSDVIKLIILAGNHEGIGRMLSPFSVFANGAQCHGGAPKIIGSEAQKIGKFIFRGWLSNDPFQFRGYTADYLVSHLRIKEWVFDRPERAYPLAELEALLFKRIFCGDLHKPQESPSGKVVSIGTLCPSNFADKDIRANYIKFDEDHNEFERIWLDYPIFRTVNIYEDVEFEPKPEYIKGNIVRLKFIGSHKFVNDKVIRQRWMSKIWLMEPHAVPDPEWEQTNGEEVVVQEEITIEEEIKQTAKLQDWSDGRLDVALGA